MSLINQMLKDLEKRQKRPEGAALLLKNMHHAESISPQKSESYRKYLIAFLGFIIIYLCVQVIGYLNHRVVEQNSITKMDSATKIINKANPDLVHLSNPHRDTYPASLTGIAMQSLGGITQLNLILNKEILYRIVQYDAQSLAIILENTQLVADMPQWDTKNSNLESIQVTDLKNGDVKLLLKLNNNAELSRFLTDTSGKNPQLQIDINKQTPFDEKHSQYVIENTSQSVKSMHLGASLDSDYQEAMQFYQQGQADQSIILLSELLARNPEYSQARVSLATFLIEQGSIDKALHVIKTGLQQRPFYPPYVQLKAKILVDQKKVDQALNLLQIAPPGLKEYPDYHAFIAALYQRSGKAMLAQQIYEELLALDSENGIWWMGLGIAYETLGRHNQAMSAYMKALHSGHLNVESKAYVESQIKNLQL